MISTRDSGDMLPLPHYSYELPTAEEERYEAIFEQLDANRDGRIDVRELSAALHKHGVPEHLKDSYAEVNFLFVTISMCSMLILLCFENSNSFSSRI